MAATNFSGPVVSEQGFQSGGPFKLKSYVLTGLPSASANNGSLILVSNAAGGPIPCFSNGTNWMRVDTNAIVA